MFDVKVLISLVLLFNSALLWAAPAITLKALLDRSRFVHPEDVIYEQRIRAVEAMQSGEISFPNPMISYEQMTASGMSSMKETKWEFKQRIPFPWKTYLSYEMYASEIQALEAELKQIQILRVAKLTTEYFRWLSLHKKLRLKKEQEILLTQLIAVQRTRYIAQKVSQVELVALQIQRGNILKEISMLEVDLAQQSSKVEMIVGPGENLKNLEPKDEKIPTTSSRTWTPSTIAEHIEMNNAELRAIKFMSVREEKAVSQSKSGWVPELELMLTQKDDDLGTKRRGWQIGVEIPLWLGGEQRAKVNQAKAALHSAQTNLSEQKRKMQLEAEAMLVVQVQLKRQLELLENGLVQWSGQNVQSAKTAYQTGRLEYASFLALMQSAYQTLSDYEDLKVKILENQEQIGIIFGGNS
jgi:outer membrane protein TolC